MKAFSVAPLRVRQTQVTPTQDLRPFDKLRAGSGLLCVAPLGLEFVGSIFFLTLQAASSLGLEAVSV